MPVTLRRRGAHLPIFWPASVISGGDGSGCFSQRSIRYDKTFNLIDGISQRLLTQTLKGLEREGLVTRTLHPTIPPPVDYGLAERGQTLIPPLVALWPWAQDHQAAMETTSRRAFDQDQNR